MRTAAALLAALLASVAISACGGGAEPGASQEATLVLDFTPNAAHAGIYAAAADGDYDDGGRRPRRPRAVELDGRAEAARRAAAPTSRSSTSTTSRSRGERGLAARRRGADRRSPAGLGDRARPQGGPHACRPRGRRPSGVTGLPSDNAVLDEVLDAGGLEPDAVDRVTIGFDAVAGARRRAGRRRDGVLERRGGDAERRGRADPGVSGRRLRGAELPGAGAGDDRPRRCGAAGAGQGGGRRDRVAATRDVAPTRQRRSTPSSPPTRASIDRAGRPASGAARSERDRWIGGLDREILDRWADWDLEHGIVSTDDVDALFAPPGEDSG